MSDDVKPRKMIVSSHHLAGKDGWQASEFEYGLIIAYNGFSRWVSRCMAATGEQSLNVLEILILHHVNHRARQKRLNDICFLLNIEDSHTVNYALKKLQKAGLIRGEKVGKEIFYNVTKDGENQCERYREIREQCLIETLRHMEQNPQALSDTAAVLRMMSGIYDQASRAAGSF